MAGDERGGHEPSHRVAGDRHPVDVEVVEDREQVVGVPLHARGPAQAAARAGTPVTAPAVKADFASDRMAPESGDKIHDIEIPLQREWRMAEALAAIGGGPQAESLIERANRPGPVPPGSLLEAIKMLGIASQKPGLSQAV